MYSRKVHYLILVPLGLAAGLALFFQTAFESLGVRRAMADVPSHRWTRFNDSDNFYSNRYRDRSAARQWEENPPKGYPTLSKANVGPMQEAIKRYSEIVREGGWKPLPNAELRPGMSGQAVQLLRHRLASVGDLTEQGGYSYDYYVEAAVKRFQVRHGLTPTGIVDESTLMALNVPATARLAQLKRNLARLRSLASSSASRYVMVNIPAAQIEAVQNDEVISRHAAVVGKIDRQTPVLSSRIHEINFNPYWHVPQSIVRKDLVPKARQYARSGRDVLSVYKIEAYDGTGRKLNPARINWFSDAVYGYSYRQVPWEDNSMGFVKINFHNAHAVYMHDTPSKSLFGRNFRAQSSGCVRVQNVHQLVAWLLQGTPGWDGARVQEMERTGERADVSLKSTTAVYFVYVTAWATKDGVVYFRRDLYQRDGVGEMAATY